MVTLTKYKDSERVARRAGTKNRLFHFVFLWKDQQCCLGLLETGTRCGGGRIKRLAGIDHNFNVTSHSQYIST